MKRFLLLALMAVPMLLFGCGDGDGPKPLPPESTILVALDTDLVPSLTDVNDALWDGATALTIQIASGSLSPSLPPRQENGLTLALASSVMAKAITNNDTLYLRLAWDDPTHDVWRQRWRVDSLDDDLPVFHHDITVAEDQAMVMFRGEGADSSDVWHWRALTTAIAEIAPGRVTGFAEGNVFKNGALYKDQGTLEIELRNDTSIFGNVPKYMHPDTSEFEGFILYLEPPFATPSILPLGWAVDQCVPGRRIDSSVVTPAKAQTRGSRWDIRSLSEWISDVGWTVVLSRALTTDSTDDLSMADLDSVRVRLAISDNFDFIVDGGGSSKQGFTNEFYLILNP